MGVPSKWSLSKRDFKTLIERLDYLLGRREDLRLRVVAADARKAKRLEEAIASIEAQWQEETGSTPTRLRIIEDQLTGFLSHNHYHLTRGYGKTITRDAGEVKVYERAPSLEIPGSEKPIINFFLNRRGGRRYLIFTPKLNRTAILASSSQTFSLLKPFGAWRGKHRLISVQSPSEEKAKTLELTRWNERKPK